RRVGRALVDLVADRRRATVDREIRARELARLEVHDAAAAVAEVARADRGEARAGGQRRAVDLDDVRAVGDAVEAEFPAAVRDDVGAVLEEDAHRGDAGLA